MGVFVYSPLDCKDRVSKAGEEVVPYSELNRINKTDRSAVLNLMFLTLCHLASDPWLM